MKPDETVSRSPLDKPLYQLTEEDIAQLTREDCRKFLRDKGMRRPSWNKSQAIEQVISLKTLLEPRTDSDNNAGFRPKPAPVVLREKENVADLQIPVSGNDNVANPKKDSPKTDILGEGVSRHVPDPVLHINNTTSARNMNSTNAPLGQMTIFYCGKVNVYNGVPADKALAILKLASSHGNVRQESPPAGAATTPSYACQLHATPIRLGLAFPAAVSPSMHNVVAENFQQYREEVTLIRDVEPDGPMSRKASVQRYLEKRKDRGKFKNKRKIGSSSSLEMYLNHQLREQNPNEQSSQSRASSPPQPRPPLTPTRCSSVENQAKNIVFSIDLNENETEQGNAR